MTTVSCMILFWILKLYINLNRQPRLEGLELSDNRIAIIYCVYALSIICSLFPLTYGWLHRKWIRILWQLLLPWSWQLLVKPLPLKPLLAEALILIEMFVFQLTGRDFKSFRHEMWKLLGLLVTLWSLLRHSLLHKTLICPFFLSAREKRSWCIMQSPMRSSTSLFFIRKFNLRVGRCSNERIAHCKYKSQYFFVQSSGSTVFFPRACLVVESKIHPAYCVCSAAWEVAMMIWSCPKSGQMLTSCLQ